MLLDVGLQHCVEVLELSVSDQTYYVYLADRREKQKTVSCMFIQQKTFTWQMRSYVLSSDRHVYLERHGQVDTKMSDSIYTEAACQEISCISRQGARTHRV